MQTLEKIVNNLLQILKNSDLTSLSQKWTRKILGYQACHDYTIIMKILLSDQLTVDYCEIIFKKKLLSGLKFGTLTSSKACCAI